MYFFFHLILQKLFGRFGENKITHLIITFIEHQSLLNSFILFLCDRIAD